MKKLILFVAVVTAISFASCSNKAKETAPEAEAPEVVEEQAPIVEEAVTDSATLAAPTETPAAE